MNDTIFILSTKLIYVQTFMWKLLTKILFSCCSSSWNLQFLQSEFKGQLPKQYENGPDAAKIIPSHMNDLNLEEPSRYVSYLFINLQLSYK
jgi:hypothetical protein